MEVEGFTAEFSSVTSSVLSDLPGTPEEIARSYTTVSDDASRALNQFGDQEMISGAVCEVVTDVPQVDGSTDNYVPGKSKGNQKRVSVTSVPRGSKRTKKDKWDVDFVIQNPKSPLVDAPLKSLLAKPDAFNLLTADQQDQITAMMPDSKHIITDVNGRSRISPEFLKYDANWSYYVSRFQEDISEGRNDPAWISEARRASAQRLNGDFDNFKDEEYEAFWGVKQKVPSNVVAGLSSALSLNTLFKEQVLRKGDIWVLRRKVPGTGGAAPILVEKEMMVKDVFSDGFITIHMPPGLFKMSKPEEREDVILVGVGAPGKVESKALEEFKISKAPNANAWKTIRVQRDNQDLGSLWDVRQAFSLRNG